MAQPSDLENLNEEFCNLNVSNAEGSKDHDFPTKKLQELECPFSWNFDFKEDFRYIATKIEGKLLEMVDDDSELVPWKLFVCNLVLCYEYGKEGNFEESLKKLHKCELTLEEQKDSPTASIMGNGLKSIILGCRCHILYKKNEKEEIELILPKIIPLVEMTNEDAASVYCMKGTFCSEYGFIGCKKSVEFIEKGLSIDNKCPEWHYMLGRSLGRIRRCERMVGPPEQRELDALENAAKLADRPAFLILLAIAYREASHRIYLERKRNMSAIKTILDTLHQKAVDLVRKVISMKKNSALMNARCALVLIKLPKPWRDLVLARDCILKALKMAPNNPMVNHIAGTYHSYAVEYQTALHYYAKAAANGVFGAEMDNLFLKIKLDHFYDPSVDLLRCLQTFKEKPHIMSLLCYLGAHYYSMKNLEKALEYWIKAIEIDMQSEKLQATPDPRLCKIQHPICEIVLMELFKLLKNTSTSKEEKVKYQDLISKYREHIPNTVKKVEKMQ